MKKLFITTFLFYILIHNSFSQDKTIKGDTAFWYKSQHELNKTLELNDFTKTKYDFTFRFQKNGQVIEVIKDSNQINVELTNYIFHYFKKQGKTLFQKIKIDSINGIKLYQNILQSGILKLKSDNEIPSWENGFDGTTIIIEHSDKKEYWFKQYWSPDAQDSIPES